jgi:acyl-CoA synthetase (AMP-forming)/AMP-acid ligase II/acetyltransferase-like isoleucine patch superfamily enzyme/acyl carrier protein
MAVGFVSVAAGATCAPLNPAYREGEFEFYLSDLGAKALLISSSLESPSRAVAAKLKVPIINVAATPNGPAGTFQLNGERGQDLSSLDPGRPDDVALVLHTSGTTARPKIVPLTQLNVCSSARHILSTLDLTANDRCLNVMPLFHIHGLIGALLSSLTAGASVVCTPGFDGERFFGWLDTFAPTWYTAVPTMHQAVLARVPKHRDVVARRPLRLIRSSSASLPPTVMADLETSFGTQVIEAYGMTEASHQMASNPLTPRLRKPGSVGIAAGPDVAVMGEDGSLLAPGQIGEVVIRGRNVTNGYENNPTANQSAFRNGWFRTGDQGRFDDENYLFLTGRLKELINRGGEKIAPREVDEALLEHPDVAQALTFALPHPTLGEDVAAAIVLKPGATATESAIREFAAARLADFKVPNELVLLEEIPKGPTGKPQRIGLADKLADRLNAKRQQNFVAARTSVESRLIDIWKDILKLDRIGIRDNFYSIGGDSLATAVLMTAVEAQFGRDVPVDSFLKSPTIENLSKLLEEEPKEGSIEEANVQAARQGARQPLQDRLLPGIRNRLFQVLALYGPGYKTTRVWLHRMRGVSIGENVSIGLSALIETAYPSLVSIGNNVTIGMRAIIIAHLRDSTEEARWKNEHTVRIEDDVYIGPGVIILPNVTIGRGAVISAGSVVSRSVPPRTLVRGNPAVPIAHCGVSLGGGVSYELFVKSLTPLPEDRRPSTS